MTADEFASKYDSTDTSQASKIVNRWRADRILDESIGGGIVLADLVHEDGLGDQVPEGVLDAFHNLTGGEVSTYDQARERITQQLAENGGDVSTGWVSTIKGRYGESQFLENADQLEGTVRLSDFSNQEGYDIVQTTADGSSRYIQVKTTGNPDHVLHEMESLHQKVEAGEITTPEGEVVETIEFAVPSTISEEVQTEVASREMSLDVLPMETSATEAESAVKASADAIGPEVIDNLFLELAGGAVAAGALHTLREGFLVYKGAKDMNQAAASLGKETALTTGGVSAGLMVETALRDAALAGEPTVMALTFGASVATRFALGDIAKRADHAQWTSIKTSQLEDRIAKIRSL
jgi:hypothetical protein